MLDQFKNFVTDRLSLDEIFTLTAWGKSQRIEYEGLSMPVPDWLRDGLRRLTNEALRRRQDDMERELSELKTAQQGDLTPTERREARTNRIKELQDALDATTRTTV